MDCTSEPFAHGQLYVAASRVRDCHNIRMFLKREQLHETGDQDGSMMPCITNIVYKDILRLLNRYVVIPIVGDI